MLLGLMKNASAGYKKIICSVIDNIRKVPPSLSYIVMVVGGCTGRGLLLATTIASWIN